MRLELTGQTDLDESSNDGILENFGHGNANEIARQIQEIGPSFTSSVEKCRQHLLTVLGDVSLDPQIVARIVSTIINTPRVDPNGQASSGATWDAFGSSNATIAAVAKPTAADTAPLSWDGSVFAAAVRQFAPTLNWHDVVSSLDHPYFNVRSKSALQLLMKVLLEGINSHTFPIGLLFRTWDVNKPGQLSWLMQIVQNPDVFYILDYNHRCVNYSCLKILPDDSNRNVAQWKCLDLLEVLFRLSEINTLTTTVFNVLRGPGPIVSCPDLLFVGVIQLSISMNQLRIHTLKQLAGQLLAGHGNAVPVLQYAWNFEQHRQMIRQIILNAMAAYYGQNSDDQTRLTRILGIAHELKPNGLAELFNLQQYPFVIDLACLASRRDFLKLDKFLDDKLTELGEPFAASMCQYMRRKCPGMSSNSLQADIFQCMYTTLQSKVNSSPVIANELNQLLSMIRNAQPQQQQQQHMTLNSPSASSPIGGFPSGPFGNLSNFIPGKTGDPSRVGTCRTAINHLPSASGTSSSASGALPFSLFQHQRDQMMTRRPSSDLKNPFDFRPLFFGGTSGAMAQRRDGSISANTTPIDYTTENLENMTFTEDVQDQANLYFQQIYSPTGRMSVQEFISNLKTFRDSSAQKDRDILMCVVKNLFDEYKFFHDYPDRELKTTAEVYGGLIREGILSGLHFANAVRKVIDAIQSDLHKPLWRFGVLALNACRSVLHRYPKVCQIVMSNTNFDKFPNVLKEFVTHGSQGSLPSSAFAQQELSSKPQQQMTANSRSSNVVVGGPLTNSATTGATNIKFQMRGLSAGGSSILNVTNVDTLINATEREGTSVKQPPTAVYDRVSFICNNLSQTNLKRKTEEMKEIIAECGTEFLEWLAQYLVMKRVTVEQNFQPLYNNFLLAIGEDQLDEFVQKETYRNVDILLRSDKRQAVSNFGDRQLLKNLGHWLGVITIGRDKPILAKDLDLKLLLLEAFYKGQQELLYVVPFVVKTLLASSKSTVFGSRCAWVYGIVKVLVEIHNEPDLKLNLKFEIEVLCKDLNIDLEEVEVGNFLKESSRLPKLVPLKSDGTSPVPHHQQPRLGTSNLIPPGDDSSNAFPTTQSAQQAAAVAAPFVMSSANLAPATTIAGMAGSESSHSADVEVIGQQQSKQLVDIKTMASQLHQPQQPQAQATFHYNDINIYSQEGLSQHLKDPSHLPLFQHHPRLKVLCKTAIVQSIKELIGGITDRAIGVAITVTEHVCRKDFALDSEEDHMRRAAHQMMRSMTAGMAAITCREPLATTILGYLKQALYNHLGPASTTNPEQMKMVEDAAYAVTEANLEVATNFIVKSACEKAISEVEKRLDTEFLSRRTARKEGRPFQPIDTGLVAMCEKVPESIRLTAGPISSQAIKIYDDYSTKICGFKPLATEDLINEFAHRHVSVTPIANPSNMMLANANGNAAVLAKMPGSFSIFNGQFDRMRSDSVLSSGGPSLLRPPTSFGMLQHQQFQSAVGGMSGKDDVNKDEDSAMHMKVELILREWMTLCYTPIAQRDPACAFVCISKLLQQNGLLSTEEKLQKFFRICADLCLDVSYRLLKNDNSGQSTVVRQRCYHTLDAFVKLAVSVIKYSEGIHPMSRITVLKKIVGVLASTLHADHETRKNDFNGMPFHRILIILFSELTTPDPILEPISWSILEAFGQALFVLQPRRVPGFSFHWLDIIGHRNFIGRLLSESVDSAKSSAMYTQLILSHLKFLAPFLRNMELDKSINFIYKGTLRVLLVILHDFPEILCEYHYVLCDVIPANCIQLRNLVLSAYPRDMRLPDPFTQSLDVIESLPEMRMSPKMHRDMSATIPPELKTRLDDYLQTRAPVSFLSDLPSMLQVSQNSGYRYNVSVVNAVVMYVGIRATDAIHDCGQRISTETIAHSAYMDIFQSLAVSMCTEGRYLLFNAIANQLRYPNSLTHYFSCTLLYLFLEANTEIIQEQITRILFERLVALRPHPWGLLITFIELIRNPRYEFWRHEFVRCAPEIERLFTSVASSCSVQQSIADDAASTISAIAHQPLQQAQQQISQ